MSLSFDVSHSLSLLPQDWLTARLGALSHAHDKLEHGSGLGGESTGWVTLPDDTEVLDLPRIRQIAQRVRRQSDVFVLVGIGGSYLGARAVLELIHSPNYNLTRRDGPQVFFAGTTLSSDAMSELLLLLEDRDITLNVVSKSGTTIETSASFLFLQSMMAERYSREELKERIIVTTDPKCGPLRELAEAEGYALLTIPENVGGRFSVYTAAGLLPMAVAGIDIGALLRGVSHMRRELREKGPENPAWQYAAARHALYESGKQVELLVSHSPYFRVFSEWWKQLFGESEGKQGRGLFPAAAEFPGDLHSMGQYIQDGRRILLETVVHFDRGNTSCPLPEMPGRQPSLDFLEGRNLEYMAYQAFRGTLLAHVDGGVPNLLITLSDRRAEDVGRLIYFFQYACGLSAYLLDVNPFDQPGVEAYKCNMLSLLGKPGFETRREDLEKRFR